MQVQLSTRTARVRASPLTLFNSSGHAPDPINAELFGLTRSYLPRTQRDRPGKLELVRRGTLCLDDEAKMPPELQGRLLHMIHTAQVMRRGDLHARQLDICDMAALTRRPPKVGGRHIPRS